MWGKIKLAIVGALNYIGERLKEATTHFAAVDAAAISALQASGNLNGSTAKLMFTLVFIQAISPEWKKKDRTDGGC